MPAATQPHSLKAHSLKARSLKAMYMKALGAPLVLRDLAQNPLCSGEIRIEIAYCGLNFGDLLITSGEYQERPELPVILGMEVSGIVREAAPDVQGFAVGDPVISYCGFGGMAQEITLPAALCHPIPRSMPLDTAAAFPIAYSTSHVALARRGRLSAGERLLVTGASGGVGLTAVEIGKVMGAEVIACARGAQKLAAAKAAGADHLLESEDPDLLEKLKGLGGVDVVYDTIGGALFKTAMRGARPEARLIPIGFASGEVPQIPANILLVKNLEVIGCYWGGYQKIKPEVITESLATLLAWFEAGKLRPHAPQIMPLAAANEALEALRNRKVIGKMLLDCRA